MGDKKACLKDNLEDDLASLCRLVDTSFCRSNLCSCRLVITSEEGIESQYYINLVGTGFDSAFYLMKLHLKKTLGSREAAGDSSNMHLRIVPVLFYYRGEVGIHADRCREGPIRIIDLEGVDLLDKFSYGCRGIRILECRKIHN